MTVSPSPAGGGVPPWSRFAAAATLLAIAAVSRSFVPPAVPAALSVTMAIVAATSFVHAAVGLALLAPLVPLGTLFGDLSQPSVAWTTPLALAFVAGRLAATLTGRDAPRLGAVPWKGPIVLLTLLAGAACIVDLATTQAIRFPQEVFLRGLAHELQRTLFSLSADYASVQVTLQFVLALSLAAMAARIAGEAVEGDRTSRILSATIPAMSVLGIAIVALLTWTRWLTVAFRHDAPTEMAVTMLRGYRITPAFPDFNAAGTLLGFGVIVGTLMAWRAGLRRLAAALALLLGTALWLTGSRSALFFLVVVLALEGLWWAWRAKGRLPSRRLLAAGVVVVLTLLGATIWRPRADTGGTPSAAVALRVELAAAALRMTASEPWFGVGLGRFYERSAEFASDRLKQVYPRENAHNNYLQWLAELGLLGFGALAWLLGVWIVLVARALRSVRRPPALAPLVAGLTFVLATCLVGHPLLIPEVAYSFWLLFGFSAGLAMAGAGAWQVKPRILVPTIVATAAVLALVAVPTRVSRSVQARALEHQGGGWTQWRDGPDGVRFREMSGHAWVFVDAGARGAVIPLRAAPEAGSVMVRVLLDEQPFGEITVDDESWRRVRLALPAAHSPQRLRRLDIEVVDGPRGDAATVWVGKVVPSGTDQ